MNYELLLGNCLDKLKELEDNSIDSIVCDPPYGLSFMNKKWDYNVPSSDIWKECLRVLKPGGHLLAFAGTRTQHRMAVNIEDAGFEIRDMIAWVYGSGFPKSLDVSKAIDKAAGAEREVIEKKVIKSGGMAHIMKTNVEQGYRPDDYYSESGNIIEKTIPSTTEAKQWEGWGTALKPALEPITMARKPFKGPVAANVLEYGTGGLNVDGCRVGTEQRHNPSAGNKAGGNSLNMSAAGMPQDATGTITSGRWPANLIHDGSDEVVGLFPNCKTTWVSPNHSNNRNGDFLGKLNHPGQQGYNDSGSAARFFYCAKVSKKERGEGNIHPTVKPIDLMRYLCRLVTPPNGTVLDPFMGSGSTGIAALKEGFNFIGIEMEEEYYKIAEQRIKNNYNEDRFSELC